jgi:NosR/NirI family transcriptional regulator, nitrous oxide reductase regulator
MIMSGSSVVTLRRMHDNPIALSARTPLAIVALVVGVMTVGQSQSPIDSKLQGELQQLFPTAASFSPKVLDPPHYKVYAANPAAGPQAMAGVAFWTTEMEPLERGYDGPIKILVGMDTKGILAGVIVVQHHEPYGDFSIATPEFAAQFRGKSIRDPFRVGGDIDAVSRATISITSATRAIKNSARRIATELLAPPPRK